MGVELDFVPANFDHLDCRTAEDQPKVFRLEIKQPAGDFFTYEEILEFFELSPANLVSCLRCHRDIIKIYSGVLTKQDREYFYTHSVDPVECLYIFSDAYFHYTEVRELRLALIAERKARNGLGVQMYLGEIWGEALKPEDSPCEKGKQIAQLKAELFKARGGIDFNNAGTQEEGIRLQLEFELDEAQQRIAALEKELAAAKAEPATTVNAAKWGNSVAAAFRVWVDIIQGDKADWKEDEFRAALVSLCDDYHTKVQDLAWRSLPNAFKNGRGRPKQNPEKSQQSDNS